MPLVKADAKRPSDPHRHGWSIRFTDIGVVMKKRRRFELRADGLTRYSGSGWSLELGEVSADRILRVELNLAGLRLRNPRRKMPPGR